MEEILLKLKDFIDANREKINEEGKTIFDAEDIFSETYYDRTTVDLGAHALLSRIFTSHRLIKNYLSSAVQISFYRDLVEEKKLKRSRKSLKIGVESSTASNIEKEFADGAENSELIKNCQVQLASSKRPIDSSASEAKSKKRKRKLKPPSDLSKIRPGMLVDCDDELVDKFATQLLKWTRKTLGVLNPTPKLEEMDETAGAGAPTAGDTTTTREGEASFPAAPGTDPITAAAPILPTDAPVSAAAFATPALATSAASASLSSAAAMEGHIPSVASAADGAAEEEVGESADGTISKEMTTSAETTAAGGEAPAAPARKRRKITYSLPLDELRVPLGAIGLICGKGTVEPKGFMGILMDPQQPELFGKQWVCGLECESVKTEYDPATINVFKCCRPCEEFYRNIFRHHMRSQKRKRETGGEKQKMKRLEDKLKVKKTLADAKAKLRRSKKTLQKRNQRLKAKLDTLYVKEKKDSRSRKKQEAATLKEHAQAVLRQAEKNIEKQFNLDKPEEREKAKVLQELYRRQLEMTQTKTGKVPGAKISIELLNYSLKMYRDLGRKKYKQQRVVNPALPSVSTLDNYRISLKKAESAAAIAAAVGPHGSMSDMQQGVLGSDAHLQHVSGSGRGGGMDAGGGQQHPGMGMGHMSHLDHPHHMSLHHHAAHHQQQMQQMQHMQMMEPPNMMGQAAIMVNLNRFGEDQLVGHPGAHAGQGQGRRRQPEEDEEDEDDFDHARSEFQTAAWRRV